LTKTRSYKIDTVGKLVLLDQDGKEIATLAQNL
jgi:putative lipoprotein